MIKIIAYILLAVLVIALGLYVINCLTNPLRQSEEQIREDILAHTPIGSSVEEVIRVIEGNEDWDWIGRVDQVGFPTGTGSHIGEQSIHVFKGQYGSVFMTNVSVFWGFDENLDLIDIRVRKTVDGF